MPQSESPEDFVRRVTRGIAALRQARGLTQDQLAELLGTATRNIRRIEAGQNLTLYTLARIARVLAVRPDDLLTDHVDRRAGGYGDANAGTTHAVAERPKRKPRTSK